jgi:hypothetical protein
MKQRVPREGGMLDPNAIWHTQSSMVPPPGSYSFGPHNGGILVKTYREGLARAVGHDLVIEVGEWSAA